MLKIMCVSLFLVTLANAWVCQEPSKPVCFTFEFRTNSDFEYCKMQVKDYLEETQNYTKCLQKNINNAINEANEVIKQFNCKASGKSYCY